MYYLLQELRLVIPNAQRINRGQYVIEKLVEACRANNVTDLIIVHEHRGIPGKIWSKFFNDYRLYFILNQRIRY